METNHTSTVEMPEPKVKLELKQNVASSHRNTIQRTVVDDQADSASADASYKKLNRFSVLEKRLLFATFKENQQIIDIKQRRNSYSSHKQAEVRACWERIVNEFNEHPETKNRTMRQIQKFWLNSKLRNQIPSVKQSPSTPNSAQSSPRKPLTTTPTQIIKRTIRNDGTIVPMVTNSYTTVTLQPDHHTIEHIVKHDPNHMEDDSQDMQADQEEEILDDDEEDVNNLIELKFMDDAVDQQQHQSHDQSQQSQTVNFHQGSMQIVHQQQDGTVQFTNMESLEAINDVSEHHHNQPQQHHHYNTSNSAVNSVNKLERRLFCGSDCGDGDAAMTGNVIEEPDHRSTDMDPLHSTGDDPHGNNIEVMSFSEQMNEIRLQDATCRLKESQLRCELQQLAVTRAQEEIRHMREIHVLNITEMQLKLDKMKKELRMSLN